jgi:hypothetical protein
MELKIKKLTNQGKLKYVMASTTQYGVGVFTLQTLT